jgi:hypothetical protein
VESTDKGKEAGTVDMYLADKTYYTKTQFPGEPTGWQKEAASADTWQKMQLPDQQLDYLKDTQVELLGIEKLDGLDCYLLKVDLSGQQMWEEIIESMASGSNGEMNMQGASMEELGQMFGDAKRSCKQWLTRDGYYLKKVEMSLDWSLLSMMSIKLGLNIDVSDFNVPVIIEVPQEAKL